MVKVLALFLSLLASPALAQGTFVTPAVSPWTGVGVTQDTSPWGVNGGVTVNGTAVVSPTAGGNYPVTVLNTVTTSPVAGGNYPVSVINTVTQGVSVGAGVTFPVSLAAGMTATISGQAVTQGTSPWGINGGVTINGTATVSPSGNVPVNVVSTVTQTVSQNTTPPMVSEVGLGYQGKANWVQGSIITQASSSQILINAPTGTNKLYITGISCFRTDTASGTIYAGFNIASLSPGTSYYVKVAPGGANGVSGPETVVMLNPPLPVAASTSLQFTLSQSINSVVCNANGYSGA